MEITDEVKDTKVLPIPMCNSFRICCLPKWAPSQAGYRQASGDRYVLQKSEALRQYLSRRRNLVCNGGAGWRPGIDTAVVSSGPGVGVSPIR